MSVKWYYDSWWICKAPYRTNDAPVACFLCDVTTIQITVRITLYERYVITEHRLLTEQCSFTVSSTATILPPRSLRTHFKMTLLPKLFAPLCFSEPPLKSLNVPFYWNITTLTCIRRSGLDIKAHRLTFLRMIHRMNSLPFYLFPLQPDGKLNINKCRFFPSDYRDYQALVMIWWYLIVK